MSHHEDANEKKSPAQQAGEENGRIKRPQQTDRNMADDDTARRSAMRRAVMRWTASASSGPRPSSSPWTSRCWPSG